MKKLAMLVILTGSFLTFISFISNEGKADTEKLELYQVGEIKISLLEPDEFTDKYGKAWVLMDGRDVSGSEFATLTGMTNVPDGRGKFLRMLNNGAICADPKNCDYDPDSNRATGSYQPDMLKYHNHDIYCKDSGGTAFGNPGVRSDINGGDHDRDKETHYTGGNETRPKNIGVNYYVKIRSCFGGESICL